VRDSLGGLVDMVVFVFVFLVVYEGVDYEFGCVICYFVGLMCRSSTVEEQIRGDVILVILGSRLGVTDVPHHRCNFKIKDCIVSHISVDDQKLSCVSFV
jgi:hypothetical protein